MASVCPPSARARCRRSVARHAPAARGWRTREAAEAARTSPRRAPDASDPAGDRRTRGPGPRRPAAAREPVPSTANRASGSDVEPRSTTARRPGPSQVAREEAGDEKAEGEITPASLGLKPGDRDPAVHLGSRAAHRSSRRPGCPLPCSSRAGRRAAPAARPPRCGAPSQITRTRHQQAARRSAPGSGSPRGRWSTARPQAFQITQQEADDVQGLRLAHPSSPQHGEDPPAPVGGRRAW